MKTYHFYISQYHVLFTAKKYENAYNRALKEAKKQRANLSYIGQSKGIFGKIEFNKL